MRALFVPGSGRPPVLAELPKPVAGPGDVVVRVMAAGLNPFDNHIAAGALEGFMEHRYPLVLGRDAAGVIDEIGDGVENLAVGAEVLAHVPFTAPFERGTIADYAVFPASQVTAKPAGLSFVEAAALPLAAGAARALVDGIHPEPGQVVLVNGASGGVGRFAVQLLVAAGATVVATASPSTHARMKELGAEVVVDYTAGPVAPQVLAHYPDGVEALVNLTGWTLADVPVDAVRRGGVARTVTQIPDDTTIAERGLTGGQIMASPDATVLATLADEAAADRLDIDVFQIVSLAGAAQGLAGIEAGRAHGKVVVDLTLPTAR
jgi:NADPH:quinone reductase-like Zn-dependent oxidoreductase